MNRTRIRRWTALLLAAVCILSLLPLPANAEGANPTISLRGITWTSGSYQSAYFQRACQIQDFHMNVGGQTLSGFCGDHSKHLNNSHIGDSWSNPQEVTNPVVKIMLAYYYTHLLGEDYWNDECIAKGFNYLVSEDDILQYNGWIQEVIWLWSTDQIPMGADHWEERVQIIADAYRESFDARNGTHHSSIDDQIVADNPNTFKTVTKMVLSNPNAWCDCPVYEYFHADSTVQPILVGYPQKVPHTETPGVYSLTVKKVDATNPNLPLPGATFRLVSTTDSSFTPRTGVTGNNGTYTFDNLPAGIYAVTETAAPEGYTIDHAGPDYVTLPGNGGNTVEKVFTDTPTVTVSGSIRKVDADDPSKGLAGAAIAIQGVDNDFFGEFTTGADGVLEGLDWDSLVPGSYRAWETAAPEGYSLNPGDVKTFRISAETPEVQLVFANDAKVKVQLVKLDSSDNPLPGAVFNVLLNGQIIATEETDASGKITVTDVETGMYIFSEVSAPAGYAKLDEPICVHVDQADIEGGGLITVTATDKKLPDLIIQKKDAATGAAVPNTTFEIKGVHTGYQQEVTTGADGTATLTGIPVDYYEVTEKNVPAPYTLSPERTQTIWLGAGEHPTLVFNNLEEPYLSIMKIDAETSTPIPGVVFNVWGIDVDYEADWTTGDDGKYTAQITPGSYRITETSVPAPYSLDSHNVRTVALAAGSERELVFENLKNPLLNLVKIDALDGTVISGTVFSVVGVDNSYAADWTTTADGTVSERIEPGTYRITEKSVPAPYYLPENDADRTQTVSLSAGEVRGLVFKDYRTPTLWIYKVDAVGGAPIQGAKFHVTYTSNGTASGAPATYDFGELYTNADGEIPLHDCGVRLYPGEYTVSEVAPAPGFQMREPTTQTVIINGSESRSVTFYNAPLNAIIVEKYDAVTGQAVPGATFRLTHLAGTSGTGGTVIGEKTTGPSGSAIWTGLEAGTYIVEEIRAPEGYSIVQSSQTVYLAANGEQSVVTVSFGDSPHGGLLIRKIDAKTRQPMAGIEFLVTDSRGAFIGNGNGKFTTDSNGSILIGDIPSGTTLVVRETQTLPGYILDTTPQTCVVQEGRTTTLEFRNEPHGTIIVYKKDAVTGAALSGVQFKVTKGNGELVAIADGMISSNGIYYSDENGQIVLSGLEPDTYVITETTTISGYVLDRTPHTIAVTAGDTQTLTITNQPKSLLLIQKYDRVTRTALAGAEFRVVPADSALAVDNEGLTSATGIYVTDEDGQISLSNLTPGAYIITETKAPEGYALDSEAQTIVARSGRTETVRFYDSALTTLQILKRDAVSHQPLAGAEFTVTTADGTRIGENNGIYVTDEDGTATVTDLTPNSAVIVSETTSPAGYVLNTTPKSIIVRGNAVNSLVFNDEPRTTLIVHKYISGTRNTPLAGCEFKVTNSRGEVLGMNNGIYTTDAQGDFMVTGLDPGLTVTVRETRTVDGYVLDGTPQDILIQAGERQELTFWNQRKGTLLVRKLDSETGNPISGVEFHIAYADGSLVDRNNGLLSSNGQYFTDSRGEITLTDVTGTIVVTEVNTVRGYYIDPASRTQTVIVNPDDAQTITFFNTPTQTLTIQKYEADSTTPISGVRFHIIDSEGGVIGSSNGDFTTDRNGQIVLNDLIPGTTVIARESGVPDDYVLDATPHSILIRTGGAQEMTVYNQRRGSLIVQKIDSATGESLAGAQFKITTADGGEVTGFSGATGNNGIFTTDRTGQITLNKLAPGAYVLTETQAPEGYVLNAQPQTVRIGAGETKTVTFGNAVKGSLIIQKFDSVTRQPLPGAEFKVTTADGTAAANNGDRTSSNGCFTTDANGQITLSGLEPAAYIVAEHKAPDNYYLNAQAQTVVVTADDVQTVSFYDEPFASLTIVKRDSLTLAPLSGAEFSVKDSGGEIIGTVTTGTDGTATISGLTPRASLVVTETHAPAGYVLSAQPQTVRVKTDAPNTVTFEDAPTGTLIIRKFITGTDNEPLPGVAFKIVDGSGHNVGPDDGVFYTDHAGEITLTGLTPGTVIKAREIRTVDGFALDGTPQDIEIQAGQTQQLTFWNARKGSLKIRKLDSVTNRPLPGVTFHITTASGEDLPGNTAPSSGYFNTDAAGEILLTGVTGTLTVTEFSTISGYVIDEASRTQTVTVSPDSTRELVFYNTPMTTLTVQKYIAGTTTPLQGARFHVTDSHGTNVGPSNGSYTTDENGRFVLTDLVPGLSVVVTEIEAPEGYLLDSTPQTIRIQSGESAQYLTFYNAPKGSISVRKLDSVTGQPVPGAEFKVTSASGVPLDNDGGRTSTNGIYRTDDNGQFLITKVEPGVYTLVETAVPEGYILNPTPLTVTLHADDAQTLTIRNQPKQTLVVRKHAAGTTTPLSGAEFLVEDSHGTKIGPNNGVYTTDAHGEFTVSGLTPGQTITVRETKTLPGYVLDGTPQTIAIEDGDAQTLTFYNSAQTSLKIIKRDSVTLHPLSGARFQVLTADGNHVGSMGGLFSSNGIFTTDASGEILITGLNPGVLVVKEITAPDGYVLDDTPQTVELHAAETQTLTFTNDPKQTVIITKFVEGTTQPLSGVTFLVTDGGGAPIQGGTGEYVTDSNGRIQISGIAPGTTVTAREVKTASGYALNGMPKSIEVQVGADNSMVFYDEPLSVLVIRKYVEGTDREPLSGVAFKVTDGSGANIGAGDGVFYTDDAGEIRIESLEAGTVVKAWEIKTVDGFVLDGIPQDIRIQSGTEHELVYWNKRVGTLIVRKLDSVTRLPLAGVEFRIAYADARKIGDSNGIFTTDSRGEINITGLNGTVVVTETATIPGYVMGADQTQTVTVNPQTAKTVTFTNDPMQTLTIRKYARGTTTPISGAVFMVSDSTGAVLGQNNGEFTTDEHGEIVVSGLIPGTTVTVREVRPASGYALHSDAQSILIRQGDAQTLTFYNTPLENLTIWKLVEGTDKPLSGVMFYVTDGAGTPVGSGEYVTDDNGRILIPGLIPGTTIIAREVKTVKGYALNGTPKNIRISSGQDNSLVFYDAPLATLVIHKYVEGTDNQPLSGVTFKVVDGNGANIGSTDGLFVTDAAGDITIPCLENGMVIKAHEVKTVDGYVLDGTPQDIQIQGGELHELTFCNAPKKVLVIRKYIADSTTPIPGVTFHISDVDGRAFGGSTGDFVTDTNGEIVLDGLTPGDVLTVKEVKAASGFVLDDTPQTIRINSVGGQSLVFYNRPKGSLTVRKIDAATETPLSGVEFKITTLQGVPLDDYEGRVSTGGIYRTDENGEIVLLNVQPGAYRVTETKAPEGYVLDAEAQTVTVNPDDAQTLIFRDTALQSVIIRKYIDGTIKPLPGVTFLVTDASGAKIGAGEYVTDENGEILISGLTPGMTLVAREVKTVKGYALNGTPQDVFCQGEP